MRRSNASILSDQLNLLADSLLEEVFAVLKENNIAVGLRLKLEAMSRIEKKIAALATEGGEG